VSFDWAALVEQQGAALGDAAATDLTAPVPAAPGWDTTALLRHIGLVHARTSVILRTGTQERPSQTNGMLPDPPEQGILEWYRATLAGLVDDLEGLDDPDRPVYSFSPLHQRAGFWPRRMAHETTVHRVDAEQAVGRAVGPIEAAFAGDGIDEVFSVFVPTLGVGRSSGDGRTVHLHTTDTEGDWLIRFDPDDIVIEPGHADADADAAVRGPAGDLLLWLWGRRPLDDVEVVGARTAAEAVRHVTTF
jgi:uncharacterized protein (TIGR03083 family)